MSVTCGKLENGMECRGASVSVHNASLRAGDGSRRPILGPINLHVAPGETIAIVGPSGAGKSTLLRLMAGLTVPAEGSLRWAGRGADAIRMGLAPQEPALLPWLTLLENVLLVTALGSRAGATAADDARELLVRFGIDHVADVRPRALSGGMQSRAALARALVARPDLLLLDEPFGSLDEVTAEQVMLDLALILAERPCTTVLVSHNLAQAVFLADRVLVLVPTPGMIVADIAVPVSHPRAGGPRTDPLLATTVDRCRDALRTVVADA